MLAGLVLVGTVVIATPAVAADEPPRRYEQAVERMQPTAPAEQQAAQEPAAAAWIWGADDGRSYKLTKIFRGGATRALLVATCDNSMVLSLNGQKLATSGAWERPVSIDVTKNLRAGDNELAAVVANEGGPAGFSCRLVLTDPDGGTRVVQSDGSWSAQETAAGAAAGKVRVVAQAGEGPWGGVLAGKPAAAAEPFITRPGFAVERLFVVPKDELGSWVSITTDPRGRLIASDQGDKGLVRITPAPLDGSKPTIVERIPVAVSGAQGLLWAFDALYVVCNGGPGSGLYRVTDSNGDDALDTVEKLREFAGGGEHGPHNIVLSPDGTRLFVICGNHTKVPFEIKNLSEPQTMGGIRDGQRRVELPADGTSRLPANWDEDLLLTRMWDANGHAAGILAPGGYVVSCDPDGKTWDVWSAGYRNPYDMAWNADGELFVYDADMEWDFGSPWYRPTRVN
ncbi:MAG: heme-binding protein, partial [Planctomycetia bacterium]